MKVMKKIMLAAAIAAMAVPVSRSGRTRRLPVRRPPTLPAPNVGGGLRWPEHGAWTWTGGAAGPAPKFADGRPILGVWQGGGRSDLAQGMPKGKRFR